MKKTTIFKSSLVALIAILLAIPAFSGKLGGKEVVQDGSGIRTKWGMKVYSAALFVPQELKGAADTQIVNADQPMSVYMSILSGMVTKDKFVTSVSEGFDMAASAGYGTADKQAYINLFSNEVISKGDTFNNYYIPGQGLTVTHNNKVIGTIKGLQFKKAFFAMFIGPKPIQASLKNGMLGK